MKLLVTGGTGVIGEGVIPQLLLGRHTVRILSRGARQDARQWPEGVEPFPADVADAASLDGAATGCQVVVHIVGIAKENPPAETFAAINVEGTRNMVLAAERASIARFVYISSLGAQRGRSEYHRSKRSAEEIVRAFKGSWVILRPGRVYGPGDESISMLLRMVRAMPVIPVVAAGDQNFQPIWYRDLGAAVAKVIEMDQLAGATLDIAGDEVTTTNDILDRLAKLTGKNPPRIGVPSIVVSAAAKIADVLGVSLPIDQQQLTMLLEENVIDEGSPNGLETLGITPTRLEEGLGALVDIQPEQMIGDGVGSVERKRFWADIVGSRKDAIALMAAFKAGINDIMPIDFAAEPGSPTTLTPGATMTAEIPMRGTVQMRVEESSMQQITLATLRGHPIAGVVRFSTDDRSDREIRFQVDVYAQAASVTDWMMLKTAGGPAQNANWNTVVERVVQLSGGNAPNAVETEMVSLAGEEATEAENWISEMILGRKRATNRAATKPFTAD